MRCIKLEAAVLLSLCIVLKPRMVIGCLLYTSLPVLAERLRTKNVEMRADEEAKALIPDAVTATEEDWGTEYLDYILSLIHI